MKIDAIPTANVSTERRSPAVTVAFFAVFLLFLGLVVRLFWVFATDLLLAVLFANLAAPSYRWLRTRMSGRDWLASLTICAGITILVAVPVTFLVISLSSEAAAAYTASRDALSMDRIRDLFFGVRFPGPHFRRLAEILGIEYTPAAIRDAIAEPVAAIAGFLYGQANALLSNILSALYHFVLTIVSLFYFLIDGRRLKSFFYRLSPLPTEQEELAVKQFRDVGGAILFGNGAGSVLQGLLGGLSMVVIGLPSPVLWGTVMSIFAFLPLVGIMLVILPAAGVLALDGRWVEAVVFLGFNITQGLFIENVVKTRMIGARMKMHNLLIFLSILGGLSVYGVIGILYGPVLVALFLTFCGLYETHYRASVDPPVPAAPGAPIESKAGS